MELSFSQLRAKEVVNTQDGRKLGKVCDIALCYPENRWIGIVVPGNKGWGRKKNDLFIDMKHIVKIGEDVVLVNVGLPRRKECDKRGHGTPILCEGGNFAGGNAGNPPRNYEEFE
jgi:YlmC/YmxH family sporulation protein